MLRRTGATAVSVVTFDGGATRRRRDRLAVEEPLEIRVAGPGEDLVSVAVTMRTPGHDLELAAGLLASEGLLGDGIAAARACPDDPNVVQVGLRAPLRRDRLRRRIEISSSCGLCGHTSIDELLQRCGALPPGPTVAPELLTTLPDRLRDHQRLFASTGGLHAAAGFAADGALLALREDVGRHNALDKLTGRAVLDPAAPRPAIVLLSGRASFELVQKAAIAGVPIVAAVSAPSSLAVDAARTLGVTLVGFLRGERANVYAHPQRLGL
ncbi:MAG: formate dehydrogenase accessory sulfurtransferase FdhD [Patulibacter sp.]|nr:formate dehydrogenase accessory sulfurtransferase FdhD [Patulibacter sp.]